MFCREAICFKGLFYIHALIISFSHSKLWQALQAFVLNISVSLISSHSPAYKRHRTSSPPPPPPPPPPHRSPPPPQLLFSSPEECKIIQARRGRPR